MDKVSSMAWLSSIDRRSKELLLHFKLPVQLGWVCHAMAKNTLCFHYVNCIPDCTSCANSEFGLLMLFHVSCQMVVHAEEAARATTQILRLFACSIMTFGVGGTFL
jgi:hypothetical protein